MTDEDDIPPYWFTPEDELAEEAIEAHHPTLILDGFEDEMHPHAAEWEGDFGRIQLACGCMIDVRPGDTVWYVEGRISGEVFPVAIEPVTIH
jgi:hypothetical protein